MQEQSNSILNFMWIHQNTPKWKKGKLWFSIERNWFKNISNNWRRKIEKKFREMKKECIEDVEFSLETTAI